MWLTRYRLHGIEELPSVSTIGAVLRRNGMVTPRRRRSGVFAVKQGTLAHFFDTKSVNVLGDELTLHQSSLLK